MEPSSSSSVPEIPYLSCMKRILHALGPTERINILFFLLLTIGMLGWWQSIPLWWAFTLLNAGIIALVIILARGRERGTRGPGRDFRGFVHGWIMMTCIPVAFKEMYHLVPAIHPVDFDWLLIAADRALFGVDPTLWLLRFAHPVVTEILQLSYSSYYLLPFILGLDLYRRGDMRAYMRMVFTVILGFYLSYIGYLALPAIGPRFTLHEFTTLEQELPGLVVTPVLRDITNAGESITSTTPDAAAVVQRDVFPSGHTQITLIVMVLAFLHRARTRWVLGVIGSLLIIGTVYLRYHYVVDLLGGAVFMLLTFALAAWIEARWGPRPAPSERAA